MAKSNYTPSYLKDLLLEELIKRLSEGEKVKNKEGNIETVDAPAATLTTALHFLKQFPPDDDLIGGAQSEELRSLAEKMRFKSK